MNTYELTVAGMTCDGCERSIRAALERIGGVLAVTADHRTGAVVVDADREIPGDELARAIDDAGYEVVA